MQIWHGVLFCIRLRLYGITSIVSDTFCIRLRLYVGYGIICGFGFSKHVCVLEDQRQLDQDHEAQCKQQEVGQGLSFERCGAAKYYRIL